ncbi:hypothetical protein Rhopal_001587-T1 [Rhodotorula paludigena]|uniref:Actin cytoskeleton organization protein n=1 Tax=Rhodotorula paludigena TaxID=86838 RepID=A0AAV5G7T7_9BASI|nr:hypothetical protein Rhopal_001587-T1 [Rhodotorula paludigena]
MASPNEVVALVRSFYASRRAALSPTDLRQIAPVCSALESFNFKRALLLLENILKRAPTNASALVLKALALSISSRPLASSARNDILKLVETLKTASGGAALADADVLTILTSVLRNIGQNDDALELLSKAVHQHPGNEELALEAFLQYVRADDRKGAQQISMKMAKQFGDDRYFWWSILSTILQLRDRSHPQGALLLSLAERQLSTRYAPADKPTASSYKSAEEYHVVSRFLELRAQYAANASPSASVPSSSSPALVLPSLPAASDTPLSPAAALLAHFASPEGDKWCEQNLGLELWRREAQLEHGAAVQGTWESLAKRLTGALEKGDTNWHTMLYLIRVSFALASPVSPSTSPSSPDSVPPVSPDRTAPLVAARDLFRRLSTDSPKAKVERGYLLALVELAKEGQARGWAQADELLPLVEQYFERFGGKACCFDDLYPYLAVLGDEDASKLRTSLSAAASGGVTTISAATRVINAQKVLRYLAPEATADEEKATAEGSIQRYYEALPLGKDLPATELQPADDFALLAGQAYVSAYQLSRDRSYLERAVVLIDQALLRSKYKYQLRILLLSLLRQLGASSLSLAHYRPFGVKNIQHDTLSHLVLARGATFAIEGGAQKEAGVFETVLVTEGWYGSGRREAREMVVKALDCNAYSKVEDFTEFRQRLDRSLQGGLVALEALRMRVLRGQLDADGVDEAIGRLEQLVATAQDSYSDNRDYKTLPNYQRKGSVSIWEQAELAPRQDLTPTETAFVSFAKLAQVALLAPLDQAADAEQAALAFFKAQGESIAAAIDDAQALPWEVLHVAELCLEAFALLELGIEQRADEMAANKLPDQAKHAKRLRTFRNSARDLVKAVGVKLTAHGKKVAKERTKFVAAVSDLQQFEALDENRITNVAHAVVESRRSAIEALGSAIHRKTIK